MAELLHLRKCVSRCIYERLFKGCKSLGSGYVEKDGKRRLKTRARNAKKLSSFVESTVKREKKAKELRARGLMDRAVSALKKLEVMRNEAMAPLHTKEKQA